MKHLLLALLFVFSIAATASAQGVRFDSQVSQQATVGVTTNVVTIPQSPVISVCASPANAVPCTNKATTYTDSTLGTPCSTSTQLVLSGTSTCVTSPDAQNNWGVWVSAGQYTYTITYGGMNYGPYFFTAGIAGGNLTPPVSITATANNQTPLTANAFSSSLTKPVLDINAASSQPCDATGCVRGYGFGTAFSGVFPGLFDFISDTPLSVIAARYTGDTHGTYYFINPNAGSEFPVGIADAANNEFYESWEGGATAANWNLRLSGTAVGMTRNFATCNSGTHCIHWDGTNLIDLKLPSPTYAPNINNILYVDGIKYPCTAAGINSAIAALSASVYTVDARGCGSITGQSTTVTIPPATILWLPGAYSGSANPLFVVDRSAQLQLSGGSITETATGANAVVLAGTGFSWFPGGVFGTGAIYGPGAPFSAPATITSTATGIIIGGSSDTGNSIGNGAQGAVIDRILVEGFRYAFRFGNNAYNIDIRNSRAHDNTQNLYEPTGLTSSGEDLRTTGSSFTNTNITGNYANCVQLADASALSSWTISGGSFDECQLVTATAESVTIVGTHFENPNATAAGLADSTIVSGGATTLSGIALYEDGSVTKTASITVASGSLVVSGGTFDSRAATTANAILNNSSGSVTISGISSISGYTSTVTKGSSGHDILLSNGILQLDSINSAFSRFNYCGATSGGTQACANTAFNLPLIVWGDIALNSATSQSITMLPFADATYSCSGSDLTTAVGIVSFNTYASASVTIVETGGANTDHLRYQCIGH